MTILRVPASLAIMAIVLPTAVAAQSTVRDEYTVTSRRSYDGSYTTKDSDGYSVTTRRSFNGGVTTKDNEGNSVTCRRIQFAHELRCRSVTVRPGPASNREMPEPKEMPEPPAPSDD